MFLNTLAMGTLISISSYSWFAMWIGLEINMLSFIPLMNESKNSSSSEASLKYFIVQAISSMIILFSFMISLILMDSLTHLKTPLEIILNSALLTKMGAAPFHFWFPEIIEGLSWINSLILLTWQKIAPMILIMYNFSTNLFFCFIISSSMIISGLKSWNQTSVKKILAFSSINHIGWMLSIMMFNQSMWLFYFSFYSFVTICLISMFKKFSISSILSFFDILNSNKSVKVFFFLNFLSMGGLPPFLGFFPKWMILKIILSHDYFFLAFIMIFFTLIMLFVYIRLLFQALTLKINESKKFPLKINFTPNFLSFLNLSGLVIFSMLTNF
uniref:NADH dehydrogenase subunit 2 n=1 Tax=Epiverta chelonia TaxID=1518448 RepID=UPI00207AEB15|nr:NADH dehydrogenase subunit 2 [Epiverta chelonia]URN72932.1 NADH dehydrogenase subunit 2 [Epiverta chelonia]